MSVCLVCQLPAKVYCENDKAFLCHNCDNFIHSANCVVVGHIRKPIEQQVFESSKSGCGGTQNRSSFDLDALLDNNSSEGDCLSNMLESQGWDDSFDIALPDWMTYGEGMEDKRRQQVQCGASMGSGPMPVTEQQQSRPNPTTITTGTPQFYQQNSRMVPCFSSTSYPSIEETDSIPESFSMFSDAASLSVVPEAAVPTTVSDVKKHSSSNPCSPMSVTPCKAGPEDRAAKIERYRAKRERRNFKKTIRYQTRKDYAEVRPRVKGRFAKRNEVPAGVVVAQAQDFVNQFVVPDSDFMIVP